MTKKMQEKYGMGEHASKIKAFYESQKDAYAAFRKNVENEGRS
jgi:hypothetical protein